MTDTNQIDRIGVNKVESIFLKMGWIFREQAISDYGIDAHAEPKEDNRPTGRLIALQIKAGKSYFRKRGDNYVYYGKRQHLDYWLGHILPVFVILHDPEKDLTIWQRVETQRVVDHGEDRWSIEIPPGQILDEKSSAYLLHGISSDPAAVRRFRLAADLPLIKEIARYEAKGTVFLKLSEWINKSLNFRESKFFIDDPEGEPEFELDTWLPMSDVNDVMSIYYPWLHYEYAREVENFYAEVDEHTLEVRLNDLGRGFLLVEDFFESGRETLNVEPLREDDSDSLDEEYFDDAEFKRLLAKSSDE